MRIMSADSFEIISFVWRSTSSGAVHRPLYGSSPGVHASYTAFKSAAPISGSGSLSEKHQPPREAFSGSFARRVQPTPLPSRPRSASVIETRWHPTTVPIEAADFERSVLGYNDIGIRNQQFAGRRLTRSTCVCGMDQIPFSLSDRKLNISQVTVPRSFFFFFCEARINQSQGNLQTSVENILEISWKVDG